LNSCCQKINEGLIIWLISFLLTIFFSYQLIPYLKKLKFGQTVRLEGPEKHLSKAGTPTMGGVIFPLVLCTILLWNRSIEVIVVLLISIGCSVIGFIDDWIKVKKKNSLGFRAREKFLCQIILGVTLSLWLYYRGETSILIPFMGEVKLGFWRVILDILAFTNTINAVNFTDGLDGLASGNAIISASTFGIMAFLLGNTGLSLCAITVVGICSGFLWVNVYPARLFMGDVGSLTLGGALAGIAIILKLEVFILVVGAIFVAEILSVIIQVISFKTTGKRVLR